MAWAVVSVEEFEAWLLGLHPRVRTGVAAHIELLRSLGPRLGRPYADTLKGSGFPNMKELRVQVGGEPWRVFFAFDPKRAAVLLLGGSKAGDGRFYEVSIPIADARYRRHLERLKRAGRKEG